MNIKKTIEQKYKKLSDIEHCLQRPSMYVGSIKMHTMDIYAPLNGKITKQTLTYNPALLKIFDEIISNSADEHRRNPLLNEISITVNQNTGKITIRDNGGIPVVKHSEYDEWVPEFIFSNLKAGSNFDDTEERLVVGTNGVGSTLTNIFSDEFSITTSDGKNEFSQIYSNNMMNRTDPVVKKTKSKGFTEISFIPSYKRFELTSLDETHLNLFRKRCIDTAACNPKLTVKFNGETYSFPKFYNYCQLYVDEMLYEASERWKIGISQSDSGFQQVSFVNGVETKDGGTHVDMIVSQIVEWLREKIRKKHKIDMKPADVRSQMSIFVQAEIINPSFSSQTKEKLITESRDFGSSHVITEKMLKMIYESEIVHRILDWAQQKALAEERKQLRELNKNIDKSKVLKLIDAKSKIDRHLCTLNLTEGDCLSSDTDIIVFRDGSKKDIKIKDAILGDYVITHNNSLKRIISKTEKISKFFKINTSAGSVEVSCSHKLWIYDCVLDKFMFLRIDELDIKKHKLVKNKLMSANAFIEITNISIEANVVYIQCDEDTIIASKSHKFAVFDQNDNSFKMVLSTFLDKNIHLLVLNSSPSKIINSFYYENKI